VVWRQLAAAGSARAYDGPYAGWTETSHGTVVPVAPETAYELARAADAARSITVVEG
jgi:hypothetical protein